MALLLIAALCHGATAQSINLDAPTAERRQAVQISGFIREVFQDRDGNLWFGTNGDGVCRYDGTSLTYLSVDEGLAGTAIRGIVQEPGGALWFATDGGVSRYLDGTFTNYTRAHGLSAASVWSMLLDTSGAIWVGTQEGVCRFDGESFVPFPLPRVEVEHPESRFTPKVVFAMFQDRAGNIWFGTDGEGAHKYDGQTFTSYTDKDGLAGNMVRCIAGDRHGRIWIGTDGQGASRLDGATFENFTTASGLSNDRIWEILEDRAGNIWFSTLGAGACRYDGEKFTAFGEAQGLTISNLPCPCGSGTVYAKCHGPNGAHVQEFLEDRDGVLWVGCSGGLFRLDGDIFVNITRDGPWRTPMHPAPPDR